MRRSAPIVRIIAKRHCSSYAGGWHWHNGIVPTRSSSCVSLSSYVYICIRAYVRTSWQQPVRPIKRNTWLIRGSVLAATSSRACRRCLRGKYEKKKKKTWRVDSSCSYCCVLWLWSLVPKWKPKMNQATRRSRFRHLWESSGELSWRPDWERRFWRIGASGMPNRLPVNNAFRWFFWRLLLFENLTIVIRCELDSIANYYRIYVKFRKSTQRLLAIYTHIKTVIFYFGDIYFNQSTVMLN